MKPFRRRVVTCKYGDPYCPCQDGDACHYETYGDIEAIPVCGNCEYFDNGKGEMNRSGWGYCRNPRSGRSQTGALAHCTKWVHGT